MKCSTLGRMMLVVAGLFFLSGQAAHADSLANIKQARKVRVGIDLGLPPYGMMDDKLQPTGLDVEVARKLAADLGVELEIVSTTGPSRVPNLQTNKADLIISAMSITPDRAKVIDFSVPYMPIQTIVFAPKSLSISSMADLAGKKVAVVRGTASDIQLTNEAKGATVVRYEDDATLITAGVTGQADILGGPTSDLVAVMEKSPNRQMERKIVLTKYQGAIWVRKNEPELLAWVNEWVKTNLKNGSLNRIYKKYLKDDLPEEILAGAK
jgi:polar amino acid transport system substrate-binding protein